MRDLSVFPEGMWVEGTRQVIGGRVPFVGYVRDGGDNGLYNIYIPKQEKTYYIHQDYIWSACIDESVQEWLIDFTIDTGQKEWFMELTREVGA